MIQTVKDMAEWRIQALEALGVDHGDGYPFQPVPGGEVFRVPNPLTIDDERNDAVMAAAGSVAIAKALLNDPKKENDNTYDLFKAAGGRAGDVLMAWRMMQQQVDIDPNSFALLYWSESIPEPSKAISPSTVTVSVDQSTNGGAPSSATPPSEVAPQS